MKKQAVPWRAMCALVFVCAAVVAAGAAQPRSALARREVDEAYRLHDRAEAIGNTGDMHGAADGATEGIRFVESRGVTEDAVLEKLYSLRARAYAELAFEGAGYLKLAESDYRRAASLAMRRTAGPRR